MDAATFQVLPQRHEIMFRDGSAIGVHPVIGAGVPMLFMRALRTDASWLVFDLRRLVPAIEPDLHLSVGRDQPGVVFYSLRLAYPGAEACVAAIRHAAFARVPLAGQPAPMSEAA